METNKTTRADIFRIDPRNITVKDGFNSRVDFGDIQELAGQIAKDGVLNPLHVQRVREGDDVKYVLVDGERRYRAVMYNIEQGLPVVNVPAIIVNKEMSEADLIRIQIQCNEGKNFTEYEYGVAYKKLKDLKMTNEEIAALVGKQLWHVNVCLAHMERDEQVQELMNDGKITGVDVRHIYQANDNESESVKDILALEEKRKEREAAALAEKEAQDAAMKSLQEAAANGENHKSEISDLKKKIKDTNKKVKAASRISLTDLDIDSNTIQAKDSMVIKQGLIVLKKYFDPEKSGNNMGNINVDELLARLQSGEYINVIASDYNQTA